MAFPIYPHAKRSYEDVESARAAKERKRDRKKERPVVVKAVREPVEVAEKRDDRPSIWKRELTFGRKKKDEQSEPAEAVAPESEEAPVAEAPAVPVSPSFVPEPVSYPTFEPEPVQDVVEPQPVFAPTFEPEPVQDAVVPEPVFVPTFESEPVPVDEPAVSLEDELRESIAALRDAAAHEPADTEKRPPLWKRELSLGRKNKDNKPEPPDAVAPEPVQEIATPDEAENTNKKAKKQKPEKKSSRVQRGGKGGKKLVGLKIGASQIAAAHVRNDGSPEVLRVARKQLERGIVVSGELRDPDALASALRVFFKENKLPKRDVRLGIASNRVGVRVLEVVGVDDPKLLGNAIRFRAQEILPIPLSEAVLDYRVLRERTDENGDVVREVLVAFAYRELVDRYTAVCRSAGIKLVGIDLGGFAMLRALVDPAGDRGNLGGAAIVSVSLGHDRSIMSVSDGATCEFTRVVEWGGASLDTAVARILALTPSQAEPIKRQLTLDRHAPTPDGLSPEQAGRARTAMVQEVHAFVREFVSSLQFYQAQPGSLDIGEIVVTGGTAHMPGLVEQLRDAIGVAVRVGNPLGRVADADKFATEEPLGSLTLAIGLGIED